MRATTRQELEQALAAMRGQDRTTAVVIETDNEQRVPGYDSWWDVAIAEVSALDTVRQARARIRAGRQAREAPRDRAAF